MRRLTISAFLLLISLPALAQDPGIMAAQQAAQQAQIASQLATEQAMQANQLAMQQAQQFNQQAMDNASQTLPCCAVAKPSLSIKPGAYAAPVTLRIKDRTRATTIFYTTDGWTPTTHSTRYDGPITLNATTALQAIAVDSTGHRSAVISALYTLPATTTPATSTQSSLDPGAAIHLVFTAPVTSKGLQVGDPLPIALADDLYRNGVLIAPKATPVLATVTQIDNAGFAGAPATLSFAVRSITINGATIPLSGGATREGEPRTTATKSLALIPVVGLSGLLIHGTEVAIPQGASLTATSIPTAPLTASK